MMTLSGVNVLITNIPENKILCVLRASNDSFFDGMYALPGGEIEPGETHHQTATRELQEEVNATITDISDKPVLEGVIEFGKFTLNVHIYTAKLSSASNLKSNTTDISQVEWITPDVLLQSLQMSKYPQHEIEKFKTYLTSIGMNIP